MTLLSKKLVSISDYAYVLEDGHVALSGPSHELLNSPAVRATYLGVEEAG